jgi:hypothetical protein
MHSKYKSLFHLPKIGHFPQIPSLDFLFRALFSVKFKWLRDCTTPDLCSDGSAPVQHSRNQDAGEMV